MPNSPRTFLPKRKARTVSGRHQHAPGYHPSQQPSPSGLGEHGRPIPASAGQGFSALCAVGFSSSPAISVGLQFAAGSIW